MFVVPAPLEAAAAEGALALSNRPVPAGAVVAAPNGLAPVVVAPPKRFEVAVLAGAVPPKRLPVAGAALPVVEPNENPK